MGCAEQAAISLQNAAAKYAPGCGVAIKSAIEIDKACQDVLSSTYGPEHPGQCIFEDITKIDLVHQRTCYCQRHHKMCELQPQSGEGNSIDINVAGPVCIDYSMMGKRQGQHGKYHQTHVSYFSNMKASKNSILLIENVTEYEEALVKKELGPAWTLVSTRMDPRCLGLPCSRARVFIVCWKVQEIRWTAPFALSSFVGALCSKVVMNAGDYYWMKSLPQTMLTPSAADNLEAYKKMYPKFKYPDLTQSCKNGRARGETKDGCLPTLTTHTGQLYSQEMKRYLHSHEALSSHCLPVTAKQAKISSSPKLELEDACKTAQIRFAGNAMSVPCVGAVLLCCALALQKV